MRLRKEGSLKPSETRVIISGGGTGGHLFPALAIAEALRILRPRVEILFVGAIGKIEMEKVPAAGYRIEGLDIRGFQRSLTIENLKFPVKLLKSLLRSFTILRSFKPQVAVGVGGYASGPLLFAAERKKIPCLIQEQNSYPGVTNKMLAKRAARICVAYKGMEKFFPAAQLRLTGNPVRAQISGPLPGRSEGIAVFGLSDLKKVILVVGGSQGARTLNESMLGGLEALHAAGIQLLWQTGKFYYKDIMARTEGDVSGSQMVIREFVDRMDLAYAAADLIISRAGAGTISELTFTGKAVILVPSPNVAEDHQTHNARSLVAAGAAVMVADSEARATLVSTAISLLQDEGKCETLGKNLRTQAFPDSAIVIATEILSLADQSLSQWI